jgi:hypothetical protein
MSAALKPGDFAVVKYAQSPIEDMQMLIRGQRRYAKWEHAVVLVSLTPLEVVEATPQGAKRNPLAHRSEDVWWSSGSIVIPEENRSLVVAAADAYARLQVGYSYLDYLAIALHSYGIPSPHLKAFIASTGHMLCSQLVDRVELDGGIHLYDDGRWPGYVAPMHLAELIGAP